VAVPKCLQYLRALHKLFILVRRRVTRRHPTFLNIAKHAEMTNNSSEPENN